jgi:GT2 family glycosyltransferase
VNTCGNSPHFTGITVCRGVGPPREAFEVVEEVPAVSGAAFVARRAGIRELGGFDPGFFLYLEDTDLSLRAVLAGHRILLVPTAEVLHDFILRLGADKIGYLERNRHAMLLKLLRWRTLLLLSPGLVLVELAVLGYAASRGPRCLRQKLAGYLWLLVRAGDVLRARRRVQRLRAISDSALIATLGTDLELGELQHPLGRTAMRLLNPFLRALHRSSPRVMHW